MAKAKKAETRFVFDFNNQSFLVVAPSLQVAVRVALENGNPVYAVKQIGLVEYEA